MSFKGDLAKGAFYIGIAKYSGIVVSFVVTAILSRILTPDDYGIVAISMVFIMFFNILSDIGIGPAIIQNKTLTREDLDNIFSYTVYSGFVLGIVFFLCSPLISDYYNNPILKNICRILSLSILFSCINITPTNLLYKEKNFRYIAFSTLVVQIFLGIISIVFAYYDWGVYALLISPTVTPLLLFLIYNARWKLKFRIACRFDSMRKILSFSSYQFLFNIVNYFSRNTDKLLIGRYISLASLGQYEKSYRMMMLPLQNITFVITPVMHPVFSEMQDSLQLMASKYCKVINLLAYIGFPLSAFFYFTADPMIDLIFGNQWKEAIPPFRILSLSVGVQIITSTTASIFQASNSTKQLFVTSLCVAVIMVGSFLVAACVYGSIVAVAYAFLFAKSMDMAISYMSLSRQLSYPILNFIKSLYKPFASGIAVFIVLYLLNCQLPPLDNFVLFALNAGVFIISVFLFTQILGEIKPIQIIFQMVHPRKVSIR